jgi:serine/threonine protein kinase
MTSSPRGQRRGTVPIPADHTHAGEILDGRYALIRTLGQGGAATIWLAHDRETMTEVAVKLLHSGLRGNPQVLERFARECDTLLRLEHPGISKLYDVKFDRERPFFVMEHIRGWTVEEELRERSEGDRRFSDEEILSLFYQLTSILDHAHERSVIHRDLKPANVMLEQPDGRNVKVLDFGIAKVLDDGRTDATTKGRMMGSLAYMSPEQTRAEPVSTRSDVFALGVLLFEVLTLRRPWLLDANGRHLRAYSEPVRLNAYNAPSELLDRISNAPRPRVSQLVAGLDPALDDVVAWALAARPEERAPTAGTLFVRLQEVIEGTSGASTQPVPVPTVPVALWAPRRPTPIEESDQEEGTAIPTIISEEEISDEEYAAARTVAVEPGSTRAPSPVDAKVRAAMQHSVARALEGDLEPDPQDRSALMALDALSQPIPNTAIREAPTGTHSSGPLLAYAPGYVPPARRRTNRLAWIAGAFAVVSIVAAAALVLSVRGEKVVPAALPAQSAQTVQVTPGERTPGVVARADEPVDAKAGVEAAKTEAAKTEAAKTEAAKTEAAKTEAARTEAARTGAVSGGAKPGVTKDSGSAKAAHPSASAVPTLRAKLAALADHEPSSSELAALAAAITRAADGLSDLDKGPILRLAQSSAKLGDLEGLERAIDLLARARRE